MSLDIPFCLSLFHESFKCMPCIITLIRVPSIRVCERFPTNLAIKYLHKTVTSISESSGVVAGLVACLLCTQADPRSTVCLAHFFLDNFLLLCRFKMSKLSVTGERMGTKYL